MAKKIATYCKQFAGWLLKWKTQVSQETYNFHDIVIKWVVVVITTVGAACGVYKYFSDQALQEAVRRNDREREIVQRENELNRRVDEIRMNFKRPYFERQLDVFITAVRTTGVLATHEPNQVGYTEAYREFGELYYGRACLFENEAVAQAMINFGKILWKLRGPRTSSEMKALQESSLKLAQACRNALSTSEQDEIAKALATSKSGQGSVTANPGAK